MGADTQGAPRPATGADSEVRVWRGGAVGVSDVFAARAQREEWHVTSAAADEVGMMVGVLVVVAGLLSGVSAWAALSTEDVETRRHFYVIAMLWLIVMWVVK